MLTLDVTVGDFHPTVPLEESTAPCQYTNQNWTCITVPRK
jgi:hypothetical protein